MEGMKALAYDPTLEPSVRSSAVTVLVMCDAPALCGPGLLVGAATYAVWRLTSPSTLARWLVAVLSFGVALSYKSALLFAWPWRLIPSLTVVLPGARRSTQTPPFSGASPSRPSPAPSCCRRCTAVGVLQGGITAQL